jgi:hypothetical protein
MTDLIKKALTAKRESKYVEFKESFDPNSAGEWCEVIKDLAAMANSGGGIIVFGLDSLGVPTGKSLDAIAAIDPADVANKILKYTGLVDFEFEIRSLNKKGHSLVAFAVLPVAIPLVFAKPGTYDIGSGKQRTAFGMGTIYFRHGAKSEPGTSDDIRRAIERQLESIRRSWIKGVKKVVQAPPGAQFVTVQSATHNTEQVLGTRVRAVNDPNAVPVRLTRDISLATGSFVHEEVSDAIFDEINNVIDANRVLAKGQKTFFLGQPVYYRIYAERHHVHQPEEILAQLLQNGIADFYAPALFWALALPDRFIVQLLAKLYLYPTNRHVHYLIRISVLLGSEFCQWLFGKWRNKWKNHPQPPSFYWTFKQMIADMEGADARFLAARTSPTSHIQFKGDSSIAVKDFLDKPDQAASIVSKACMRVFQGDNDYKSVARNLDYLAYGPDLQRRAPQIVKALMKTIGERAAGDVVETTEGEL